MSSLPPVAWIGRWLMAVSAIHFVFGLLAFGGPLQRIAEVGWWGGIEHDDTLAALMPAAHGAAA